MRVFSDHFSSEPWQWSTMHYWRIGHPLDLTDVVLFFLTMLAMGLLHITRPVLPRYVIALDYPPATASSMAAVCGPTPNCSRSLGACWLVSWSSAAPSFFNSAASITSVLPTSEELWLTSAKALRCQGYEDVHTRQCIVQDWLSTAAHECLVVH